MRLLNKLELMKSENNRGKGNSGALTLSSLDNLSKLTQNTSMTLSRNAIDMMAGQVIQDVSKKMRSVVYLIIIFDVSGSMDHVISDMAEGYEQLKQKLSNQNVILTFVKFGSYKEVVCQDTPIENAPFFTQTSLGKTRLFDTTIETIQDFDKCHPEVGENAIFVMATDGADNLSEIDSKTILRGLVKENIAKGRKFYFLGDCMEAIENARDIGISDENIVEYTKEDKGFVVNFLGIEKMVEEFKQTGSITNEWKQPIVDHRFMIEQKGNTQYSLRHRR